MGRPGSNVVVRVGIYFEIWHRYTTNPECEEDDPIHPLATRLSLQCWEIPRRHESVTEAERDSASLI